MKKYIVYRCKVCHKYTILISEEVNHSEEAGKYMTCGHDGRHKKLSVAGAYDNLKECMDNYSYVKVAGRIRQRK